MNTNLVHKPSIPGWGGPEILNVLGTYAQLVPEGGAILELGGLYGRTTYTLGKNKHDSVKLITIDYWPNIMIDTHGYHIHDFKCGKEELTLLNSMLIDNDKSRKLTRNNFFKLWSIYTKDLINHSGIMARTDLDNSIFPMLDLIYQDAAHSYEGVRIDLVHWFPKLKSDGVLIVDDYCPVGWPGVVQAVDEFVTENNLDATMVTRRNILLKRKND